MPHSGGVRHYLTGGQEHGPIIGQSWTHVVQQQVGEGPNGLVNLGQ